MEDQAFVLAWKNHHFEEVYPCLKGKFRFVFAVPNALVLRGFFQRGMVHERARFYIVSAPTLEVDYWEKALDANNVCAKRRGFVTV